MRYTGAGRGKRHRSRQKRKYWSRQKRGTNEHTEIKSTEKAVRGGRHRSRQP